MENGAKYNIPKGVRYANIQIAISDIECQTCRFDIRKLKLEMARRKNKKILMGFSYIGYEKKYIKNMSMEIERHWYIDFLDLDACSCSWDDNYD